MSFYICIQLPKRTFATGHSHVSGWRVVFTSSWNKDRAFILRDWGLGADFLLLLGVHGFASSTGLQEWRYLNCKIKIHQRNSSESSEKLEGIAKTRADEVLLWKELSCAQQVLLVMQRWWKRAASLSQRHIQPLCLHTTECPGLFSKSKLKYSNKVHPSCNFMNFIAITEEKPVIAVTDLQSCQFSFSHCHGACWFLEDCWSPTTAGLPVEEWKTLNKQINRRHVSRYCSCKGKL